MAKEEDFNKSVKEHKIR